MWKAEKLSPSQIEQRAQIQILDPLIHRVGQDRLLKNGISFDLIYDQVILPDYGVAIVENANLLSENALACYEPTSNTVYLDASLNQSLGDPRRAFTLFHEACGHGVLQGSHLRKIARNSKFVSPTPMVVDTTLEWQANYYASCVAAPMYLVNGQIILRLKPRCPIRFRGPSTYFLGPKGATRSFNVHSFSHLAECVGTLIRPWFGGLSLKALSIQVQKSPLLIDETRPPTVVRLPRLRTPAA